MVTGIETKLYRSGTFEYHPTMLAASTIDGQRPIRRPGGRYLDPTRDGALHAAALELLAEIGYDRLTMDAIAARAHAGKATIYRRWSGKADLVVDALTCRNGSQTAPDTGTLRGDLEFLACGINDQDSHRDIEVMIGLVSALPRDPELREVFQERLVAPAVASVKEVFERAVGRGEIAQLPNLDLLVSVLPALVLHRVLVLGERPDGRFMALVIDEVLLPLVGVPATTRSKRRTARLADSH
jgi:AcrR family transcriptional regulator